jgi:hypothetical protein
MRWTVGKEAKMAWIESHQAIENHPKTHELMGHMGWSDVDLAIGKLHRIWWWALDYAPDGDLRKYNDSVIGGRVGLYGADATKFVKAMVDARWLDRKPYFRIHDWWTYVGKFLQIKWKHAPDEWQRVKDSYNGSKNGSKNRSKTRNQPTLDQPTNPEPTNQSKSHCGDAAKKPARKRPLSVQQRMVQALADVFSGGIVGKRGGEYGGPASEIIDMNGTPEQVMPRYQRLLAERGGKVSSVTCRTLASNWARLDGAELLDPSYIQPPTQAQLELAERGPG